MRVSVSQLIPADSPVTAWASCVLLSLSVAAVAAVQTELYANFEGAQTSPVRLSKDGARLYAVNTAAGTLSVFDVIQPANPKLIAQIPVGLEPVSVNPLTNDEVWVVNQASDSISVVSVSQKLVTDTIYIKDEPTDVVFAGPNQAFVSVSRKNAIAVFSTISHDLKAILPVFGGNPRALAVSPNGDKVYAAFALAGNGTTIVGPGLAPPQPAPVNPNLPGPPRVGLIVKANDPLWSSVIHQRMPDNDVAIIDASAAPSVIGYYSRVGTTNLGLAVNPATGDIYVANTEARNEIRFEPSVRGHWVDNRVTRICVSSGEVTPFDLNPGINYSLLPNPAAKALALAQPAAVAFEPAGNLMYVAAFGTDRIAVLDTNGNIRSRIEVGPLSTWGPNADPKNKRGPRGLALHAAGRKLYVLNRISNTLSVIDTTLRLVIREIPVGYDPTPLKIRKGRGFLYDAKLSGNGTGSCASCHIDGDMDHLAWDLGDPGGSITAMPNAGRLLFMHPMKGPMTTQTLRGLADVAPYHWRGDRGEFAAFNPAFDSLMGGAQLSTEDMAAFTDFINTLLFQPNPWQNLDRSFSNSVFGGDAAAGRDTFINAALVQVVTQTVTCNACHAANPGPGTNRFIQQATGGTSNLQQNLKVPHLRNVYQKLLFTRDDPETIDGFGIGHNGRVPHLQEFLLGPTFAKFNDTQRRDLAAFVISFDTGAAPAVGYTRTIRSSNLISVESDWLLLESQARTGNIDLLVYGVISGAPHGLFFSPAANFYWSDTPGVGPFTHSQLRSLIQDGDILTITGHYPGTGFATFLGRGLNNIGK